MSDLLLYTMVLSIFWLLFRQHQQVKEMEAIMRRLNDILRKAGRHD